MRISVLFTFTTTQPMGGEGRKSGLKAPVLSADANGKDSAVIVTPQFPHL